MEVIHNRDFDGGDRTMKTNNNRMREHTYTYTETGTTGAFWNKQIFLFDFFF